MKKKNKLRLFKTMILFCKAPSKICYSGGYFERTMCQSLQKSRKFAKIWSGKNDDKGKKSGKN